MYRAGARCLHFDKSPLLLARCSVVARHTLLSSLPRPEETLVEDAVRIAVFDHIHSSSGQRNPIGKNGLGVYKVLIERQKGDLLEF
jgi:hypothetical protein